MWVCINQYVIYVCVCGCRILSGVAQSAYKMCGDIRLLANLKEIEEPFGKDQVGPSHHPSLCPLLAVLCT